MRLAIRNIKPLILKQPPTGREPALAPSTNSPPPLAPNNSGLHILAVDDNVLNLQLLRRFLLRRTHDTVTTALNGLEALTCVRTSTIPFDVIFMDISMPIMDGFEATKLIRSLPLQIPSSSLQSTRPRNPREYIIALTGLASRRDRDRAEECGFDDFLTKPISFGKIEEMLGRLSMVKTRIEGEVES
jgi:CheY-like chemotaxis protein